MTKVIDIEIGKKVVSGDESRAKMMLQALTQVLPDHEQKLKAAFKQQDWEALLAETHKLHGGTCYCGVPRLKNAAAELESSLKTGNFEVKSLYDALIDEVDAFKKEVENFI